MRSQRGARLTGVRRATGSSRRSLAPGRHGSACPVQVLNFVFAEPHSTQQHPQGTDEQLVADMGSQFHPDYAVVLRALLFAADRHQARGVTGIITAEAPR